MPYHLAPEKRDSHPPFGWLWGGMRAPLSLLSSSFSHPGSLCCSSRVPSPVLLISVRAPAPQHPPRSEGPKTERSAHGTVPRVPLRGHSHVRGAAGGPRGESAASPVTRAESPPKHSCSSAQPACWRGHVEGLMGCSPRGQPHPGTAQQARPHRAADLRPPTPLWLCSAF